ncbi:MAG TPA: hypothetical protein VGM56_03450 [Byssovorax sp.]
MTARTRRARAGRKGSARDRGEKATAVAEARARRMLLGGGVAALVGLAAVATGASDVGMTFVLAGLVVLIAGIHVFGRLGPALRLGA